MAEYFPNHAWFYPNHQSHVNRSPFKNPSTLNTVSFSGGKKTLISFKIQPPLLYSLIQVSDKWWVPSLMASTDTRGSAVLDSIASRCVEGWAGAVALRWAPYLPGRRPRCTPDRLPVGTAMSASCTGKSLSLKSGVTSCTRTQKGRWVKKTWNSKRKS